jgi:putative hydrolase of the HAD superfamily
MRLFDQIERKMTAWVSRHLQVSAAQADALRQSYWQGFGTTLAGLMHHHAVDPEPYLADVHDIDFSALSPDPQLAGLIRSLPGRRIVFTNGDRPYAEKVLTARGLEGLFDAVYGVAEAGYVPKPAAEAFDRVFDLDGLDPARAAMFEDDIRNLAVPHDLGMTTVLIGPAVPPVAHVHHQHADLTAFLAQVSHALGQDENGSMGQGARRS